MPRQPASEMKIADAVSPHTVVANREDIILAYGHFHGVTEISQATFIDDEYSEVIQNVARTQWFRD